MKAKAPAEEVARLKTQVQQKAQETADVKKRVSLESSEAVIASGFKLASLQSSSSWLYYALLSAVSFKYLSVAIVIQLRMLLARASQLPQRYLISGGNMETIDPALLEGLSNLLMVVPVVARESCEMILI